MNLDGVGTFVGDLVGKFADYKTAERQHEAAQAAAALDQRPAASATPQSFGGIPPMVWVAGGLVVVVALVVVLRKKG